MCANQERKVTAILSEKLTVGGQVISVSVFVRRHHEGNIIRLPITVTGFVVRHLLKDISFLITHHAIKRNRRSCQCTFADRTRLAF
jgi:hypothetical protein